MVIDGLENLFAQNLYITAHAILRALNNRRFIYFVTMKLDYNVLKEQEKKAEEERGQHSHKWIILCYTALYCVILHYTLLYCIILCYSVLYFILPCYTVLHCVVLSNNRHILKLDSR